MKKLICTVLCVLMLAWTVGCQAGGEKTEAKMQSLLTPPVKGLEWGMTLEEVQTVLEEAGAANTANESADSYWIDLSEEDTAKLGMETVAGLTYNGDSPTPISILFLTDSSGLARCTSVLVDVVVPTEESHLALPVSREIMTAALTKVYGEPAGDAARWGTTGKKITEDEAAHLTGAELALLESNDYDAFYVYPMLSYSIDGVHNMEATLMYDASGYVHLLYGY